VRLHTLAPSLALSLALTGCAAPAPDTLGTAQSPADVESAPTDQTDDQPTPTVDVAAPPETAQLTPAPVDERAPTAPAASAGGTSSSALGVLTYAREHDSQPTALTPLPLQAPPAGTGYVDFSRSWTGTLSATDPGTVACTLETRSNGRVDLMIVVSDAEEGSPLEPGQIRARIHYSDVSSVEWPNLEATFSFRSDDDTSWAGHGSEMSLVRDQLPTAVSWDGATLRFAVATVTSHEFGYDTDAVGTTHLTGAVTC
jgi:hypothetical protein